MFDPRKYKAPKLSRWDKFVGRLDDYDQVRLEGLRSNLAMAKTLGQPEDIAKKQNSFENYIKSLEIKYNIKY